MVNIHISIDCKLEFSNLLVIEGTYYHSVTAGNTNTSFLIYIHGDEIYEPTLIYINRTDLLKMYSFLDVNNTEYHTIVYISK